MANILAHGEVTIVDISDVGKLSAYLTSNQPTIVIYDPNSSTQYTPNWASNHLVLTPVLFFNENQLGLTDSGVSITWQRQAGSGSITDLVTGETASNGKLTVSNNVLSSISSGLVTYICSISYTDPNTNVEVNTKAQMSFSLVKNATELKDCSITGDQTFKYNGEGTLVSSSTITLNANLTNVSISQWQYKNSSGEFVVYPNSSASTTLTVRATDNVFVNDTAIIKLVTNDSSIFDLHQIVKLRDGAAGDDTYTCVLDNDAQLVPCDANGNLYESSLNGCESKITIYEGADDDTANWNITPTPSTGITGSYNDETYTYTVTGVTVDSGYVEFIATRSGHASIVKRFTIIKQRSGADGEDAVIYQLTPDVSVLTLNASNVFSPNSVTFSAKRRVGNATSATNYSGRFKIYESTNGSFYGSAKYTSGSNEASKTYAPSSTSVKAIKCELYASGGTTTLLDTQIVSVVSDGKNGAAGAAGSDAINVVLGNSSEVIPCTTGGAASAAKDITIPFSCYKGTKRIAGTATLGTLPSGVTTKSNTAATTSADGTIVLTVAKGATLSSADSGDITITVTAGGLTSTHKFTWTKSKQAANGANAILFQIYAPQGDVIVNKENNVVLQTTLTNGTTVVSSGITYQWAQYKNTAYQNIQNATSASLTVTPSMVDSVESFRCTATYNSKSYVAYWCVTDKSDPVSVEAIPTLGDKIVNSQGVGAIYAMVYRNGEELDPIKSTQFLTTAPSNPSKGDFYYKVNKGNKTVTLMKYNGTQWSAASGSDLPQGTYEWYRRNSDGTPLDTSTPYATGKAIYLDSSVVDGKTTFRCKFTM